MCSTYIFEEYNLYIETCGELKKKLSISPQDVKCDNILIKESWLEDGSCLCYVDPQKVADKLGMIFSITEPWMEYVFRSKNLKT